MEDVTSIGIIFQQSSIHTSNNTYNNTELVSGKSRLSCQQVTSYLHMYIHLLDGQGLREIFFHDLIKKSKQRLPKRKQNYRAARLKGKLEIKDWSSSTLLF